MSYCPRCLGTMLTAGCARGCLPVMQCSLCLKDMTRPEHGQECRSGIVVTFPIVTFPIVTFTMPEVVEVKP